MKVAITGASGHVGHSLCRELINSAEAIKVLQHNNEDDFKEMGVETIQGDLQNIRALDELFRNTDVVFHLAAEIAIDKKNKDRVYDTNVTGTKNVIEACRRQGVKKLVHFSTIHTLHPLENKKVLDETNPLISQSNIPYESSKAEGERLVIEATKTGLDAVIINPTAIIGPFDYGPSYLGQALIKIYQNKLPMLVTGGYDFVDVRDVALAAIMAAKKGRQGERYILSGNWLSLKQMSELIGMIFQRKTPQFIAPTLLAYIGLPFINVWSNLFGQHPLYTAESLQILLQSVKNISNEKARKELDFNPRPLEKTLLDLFQWYEQNELV